MGRVSCWGKRCKKGSLNENDCMRGQPEICNVCAAPFSLLFFLIKLFLPWNQRRKITLKMKPARVKTNGANLCSYSEADALPCFKP